MTSEGDRLGKESAHLTEGLPTHRLGREAKSLLEAFAERVLESVGEKVSAKVDEFSHELLEKVESEDGGGPGVKAAISGVKALNEGKGPVRAAMSAAGTGLKEKVKKFFGGGKGKKALKLTNIVETFDIGAPLRLVYDQWTQYEDFPNFMKKVEHVERPEEEKSNWKAQIFWSHRAWEATTLEQVPDDHIVWRSKGAKGYVDGAVSFSELAPNLTRICLVMEYHPQGLFEHTGNLWRAQGRRARLEFKHFRRHVMAHAILKPDDIEGWRGEIRDGEVVKTHEEALEEEEERARTEEEHEGREEEPREEEEGGEVEEEGGEEAAEGEPEEPEEEEEEPEEQPGEAAEEEGEEESEGREEAEAREEPEEPEAPEEPEEPPRRPRRRPPDEGERPPRARAPRRRPPPEDEDRPRRPRRRPPAEEDEGTEREQEERPAPVRRPRRRPPRDRDDEYT
jgi:uncharacterized membrane protein